jgi:hypothetical protein
LSLGDTVADDPQLVAVQLDHSQHTNGQHVLAVLLVEQVLLAISLGQRRGQLGRQVRRRDLGGQRKRQ